MAPPKANDKQVGGSHYKRGDRMQHWDMVREFDLDYFQAQVTRYLFRWRQKHGLEDLRKAQHYLEKYIELAEQEAQGKEENGAAPAGVGYVDQDRERDRMAGGETHSTPSKPYPSQREVVEEAKRQLKNAMERMLFG